MQKRIVLAVMTGLLVTGGCSGHPPYPKTWPSLGRASKGPCERFAGTYRNQGERAQATHYGPIAMAEMLVPDALMQAAESVSLSFADADRLEIVMTAGDRAVSRSLLRRSGQFTCKDGSLEIHKGAEWVRGGASHVGGPGPIPVVGGESVTLKLDLVDDYLVITKRNIEFMWLPFPGRSTWSSWYRFKRLSS